MKTVTLNNLKLRFDAGAVDVQSVREAVELVNLTLQREPYGLCAQVILPDVLDYSVMEFDDEPEEDDPDDEEADPDDDVVVA